MIVPMRQSLLALFICSALGFSQMPDLEAQKTAMKKLAFLAGKWSGDATAQQRGPEPVKIAQTEDIQFRLDGLILLIEGTGRDPVTGKSMFNALGIVNYDDLKKEYRIKAYNGGRTIEAPFEVSESGFAWAFKTGPADVRNEMKVDEKGMWIETTTVKIEGRAPFTTVRMSLKKD